MFGGVIRAGVCNTGHGARVALLVHPTAEEVRSSPRRVWRSVHVGSSSKVVYYTLWEMFEAHDVYTMYLPGVY